MIITNCLGCGKEMKGRIGYDGLLWTLGLGRRLAIKVVRHGKTGYLCKDCHIGEAWDEINQALGREVSEDAQRHE